MSTTRNTVGGVSVAWLAVLEARLVPIGIGRLMDSSMNRRTPFAACQSRASCLGEPCPRGLGAKDSEGLQPAISVEPPQENYVQERVSTKVLPMPSRRTVTRHGSPGR